MENSKTSSVSVSPTTPTNSFQMNAAREEDDIEHLASERDELLSTNDQDFITPSLKPDPWRSTRILLYIAVFVANLSFQILNPSQTRIFEQVFCYQHYEQHDPSRIPASGIVPEDQCKIASIQQAVATLRAWYQTFDAAPALLMSIPAGIVSDIIGRRPILLLGLVTITAQQFWIAFICSLNGAAPLQLIWLAPLLNFLSGGVVVLNMIFVCVICDITSKEALAPAFFRLTGVYEFTKVLGPTIAGALMQRSAWWALATGLTGLVILFIVSWFVPETLAKDPLDPATSHPTTPTEPPQPLLHRILIHIRTALRSLSIITSSRHLLLLIALTPLTTFGATLPDILQQYISVRYHWTLANSAFLFSLQAIAATFSLFLLLPLFTTLLTKHLTTTNTTTKIATPPSPTLLSARTATYSLALVSLAWLVQSLSPNIPLFLLGLALETLGLGAASALKALAASLVGSNKDNGRVFSVLTVAGGGSAAVAHPLTAALFGWGLDKGEGGGGYVWLGLPFWVGAGCAAVAAGVLGCVRWEGIGKEDGGEGGDEDGDGDLGGGGIRI